MYYSSFGILAFITVFIVNYGLFFPSRLGAFIYMQKKTSVLYRKFLGGVLLYYLTDILWGFLSKLKFTRALFFDTEVYFLTMAFAVFLWTRFVIAYLHERNKFAKFLKYSGLLFLLLEAIVRVINFFYPVIFYFDEHDVYRIKNGRNITLLVQIIFFFFTSLHTFFVTIKSQGKFSRRNLTIALFGLVMIFFICLQIFYPLLPFYALGYMLGTCLIHTFVLEDEKQKNFMEYENLRQVGEIREAEIDSARLLAFTDALTGVKNRSAYLEDIVGIEKRIQDGLLKNFALAVFDINDLKITNDMKGHGSGDLLIKNAVSLICKYFNKDSVYRIGGDEFVAFVMGEDFQDYAKKVALFNSEVDNNLSEGKVVVALGNSEFSPDIYSFTQLFNEADKKMYERKLFLKNKKQM